MQTKKKGHESRTIFGAGGGGRNRGNLKDNINEHEKSKNIRRLCRGVAEFEKGHTSVEVTG
jgi:hypothetical protein